MFKMASAAARQALGPATRGISRARWKSRAESAIAADEISGSPGSSCKDASENDDCECFAELRRRPPLVARPGAEGEYVSSSFRMSEEPGCSTWS